MMRTSFLFALCGVGALEPRAAPQLPRRFEALIETIAHQLEPSDRDYPPRVRQLRVLYDYVGRRCRVDEAATEGVPARASLRRFDLGFELQVRELGSERVCAKSRMREAMPPPRLPRTLAYAGEQHEEGRPLQCWRDVRTPQASGTQAIGTQGRASADFPAGLAAGDEIVTLCFAQDDSPARADAATGGWGEGRLVRVDSATVSWASPPNASSPSWAIGTAPLMSWRLLHLRQGAEADEALAERSFTLAAVADAFFFGAASDVDGVHARAARALSGGDVLAPEPAAGSSRPLNVSGCERLPQDMGFPYMQILHSYVYV